MIESSDQLLELRCPYCKAVVGIFEISNCLDEKIVCNRCKLAMKFTIMLDSYGSNGEFVVGLDASFYYDCENGYWKNNILDFSIKVLEELNLVEHLSKRNTLLEVEALLMVKTKQEPIFQNQTQSIRGFLEKNCLGSPRIRDLCEKHGIDLDSPWPPQFPSSVPKNPLRAEPLKRADAPAPRGPAKVIRLPVWPEAVRGVPNGVLRSALFGAIRKGRRRALNGEIIAATDGVTIRYTGWRLDQADLDVWEQCLQLARQQGLGCQIEFSAGSFLKAIGRNTSGANHEWLKGVFRRLTATAVEIQDGRRSYFGPLLHNGARDDRSGQYVIELNPEIVRLYGPGGWTQIEWSQRQALKGLPLAQWLHGFYSTHAQAFPVKVETLHRLCGSEAEQMYDFRKELREALEHLAQAAGWDWKIDDNDLVHVERTPSRSQQKHLAKKPKKPHPKRP